MGVSESYWFPRDQRVLKRKWGAFRVCSNRDWRKAVQGKRGDVIFVEKLNVADGEKVTFDKVLAVSKGDELTFGAPYVEGAAVTANVVKSGKSKKIDVIKYKAKKNEKKKIGHRQPYTKVQIESIALWSNREWQK